MGSATDSVEFGFVELESIDLESDSVVDLATERAQLIETVVEIAQVDAEVGPAAVLELAFETAGAPEVGAHARQQVDHGAGLVDSAGLRGPMEALPKYAEMAGNEQELLQLIDLGIALP